MPQLCCKPNSQKDKGYAWFISVASFLLNFTHTGFTFGIAGNLTIAHQQFFNINLQNGSLAGSIHFGALLMFGKQFSKNAALCYHATNFFKNLRSFLQLYDFYRLISCFYFKIIFQVL